MVFKYLVLDSGAIIRGHGINLHQTSEQLVTIPEVLAEIRDEKSRQLLASLPHTIITKSPTAESMKFVTRFAQQTGDYNALSVTDMKLIALTHSLELEINKGEYLREKPKALLEKQPNTQTSSITKENKHSIVSEDHNLKGSSPEVNINMNSCSCSATITDSYSETLELKNESIALVSNIPNAQTKESTLSHDPLISEERYISKIIGKSNYTNSNDISKDDDNKGWINNNNIINEASVGLGNLRLHNSKNSKNSREFEVACMTADFAMQNVIMQIGMAVCGIDGRVIRNIKQWILRCNGCYTIHYDMSKLFCSRCGLGSLSKISAHIDSTNGELVLHLKKNYKINTRGTIYSLPKPSMDNRFEGDLLLREDQMLAGIWRQKANSIKKNIKSAFGDEILNDVGLNVNLGNRIVVGMGKKNPNAMKGRERRGAKKK